MAQLDQQAETRPLSTLLQVGTLLQLADGRVQACDAGVEPLLGYTSEQLIGTTIDDPPWQTIHTDGKPFQPEEYPSIVALKTGQRQKTTMGFYQPSGHLVWLQVEASPLFQSDQPYAVVVTLRSQDYSECDRSSQAAIFQDATERTQALIRKNEARYRALIELSPQIVYVSDPNGMVQYCNQWGLDFTGRSINYLRGYGWTSLVHPEYRDRTYTAWINAFENNGIFELETLLLRADGQYRWVYSHASPVRNESGAIEYWIGIVLDIHDRKEAELAASRQEAEFRQLANAVPQMVWVNDETGKKIYVNQQWIDVFGLTLEEAQSAENLQSIVHPDDLESVFEQWEIALATETPYRIEARMRHAQTGEYRWFLNYCEPFRDGSGSVIRWFGTATDITETKRRELYTAFLAEISQELTIDRTETEMMQVLGEKIGQFFNVFNCAFAQFDSSIDRAVVYYDWRKDKTTVSLVGEYSMAEYAPMEFWHQMVNNQPVIVNDIDTDPRIAHFAERYHAINIGAFVDAPFVSDRGIQFAIALHHQHPYYWRPDEVELLQQLTTRIWSYLERDRALQQLKLTEARLQDILSSIHENFLVWDDNWNVAYLNTESANTIGATREELIGKHFWDIYPNIVGTEFWEMLQQVKRDRTPAFHEFYYPESDRWYANRTYPTSEGVVNVSSDITDRKRIEEDLRQKTAILNTINEATAALVYVKDRQGRYVHANPAALEVLGRPENEIIGQCDRELFGKDIAPIIETDQRIMTSGQMEAIEETIGERTFLSIKVPQRNTTGEVIGLMGVSTDISDRVQLERDREQVLQREQAAREAAEQANRMKDEFLAVLSHELRSPLNPILGWTKILRTGNLSPERTAHALETIERNAQLQSELIEDLLDVARILQGKLRLNARPVNVANMIHSAIETVRLAAESKGIAIETRLSEVGEVSGDATRLQQIVWNLLSNAVKFTPSGGQVIIQLQSIDHQAQITITDTGKGISPSFLPHVFDYFRQEDGTTTRKFGGLGLGLAIVRHLVELHNGTVSATSEGEGLGATFTVTFPLITVASVPSEQIDQPNLNNLRGMRLLIVDDEPDSREFVAFVLEQAGAQVTIATSGSEAFSELTRSRFDVLVSDIGMPDLDGYRLLQQVRKLPVEQGGTVNAIALTAYAGDTNQQQALQAGFQAHLAKPIEPARLVQAVAKLRDRL
ncbi:PAS domain S-box protein [Pseudanabaenaceae cyanobacterium LEGE 13415]|nr:PAS domain S-box protein [Pseudanabaenaceae cyanobacterium LEGE 13415]